MSSLIRVAAAEAVTTGEVVEDDVEGQRCLFLKGLYLAEQSIAERLLETRSRFAALASNRP